MIDLVVPSLRKESVERLLHSLSLGTRRPGTVSIVSNEVDDSLETYGLNVRFIRFTSDYYAVGYRDVALRCNIGVFASEADMVLISGDDQIAAYDTIELGVELFRHHPFWFGHHRFVDFNDRSVEYISRLAPSEGIEREHPPNAYHLWQSCYSGSFGIRREVFEKIGGFDMVFNCRHGGEDQNLGKRLLWQYNKTDRVFIYEPPFWWHPIVHDGWTKPVYTNLCAGAHALTLADSFETCTRCPYKRYIGPEAALFGQSLIAPYDNDLVKIRIDRPHSSLLTR